MTSTISRVYSRVAQGFTAQLQACTGDLWNAPSPCPDWTARDVAAHVVGNHRRAVAGLDGTDYRLPGADEDVVAAWLDATADVQARLDSTAARHALGDEFGNLPFEQFVHRMACADTLIHTWDFARATGQDERLDPEAVDLAWAFLSQEDRQIRLPHAFGPRVDAGDDVDPQTRLLSFLGRSV